ncbi:hypothetical protein B4166_2395 [Caldibacillus thermoamylovorans]|uniref:Uncharacterized protein n=1 Tax=Caldibacillus thermoamylovorans TaxID=35841 RepID=A0ABD4A7U7_9BACI|nr:hypothetical protein B4166_2395 [Caldibacillus thermoamylovorans]KIO73337.1 hypothetical protein B4167_2191 [Caldibacillus thermoamylovorans]
MHYFLMLRKINKIEVMILKAAKMNLCRFSYTSLVEGEGNYR